MANEQLGSELVSKELLKYIDDLTIQLKELSAELVRTQKSFDQTSNKQKDLTEKEKQAAQITKNLQKAEQLQKGQLDELTKSKIKLAQATKETNARLKEQMGITQQSSGFMNKLSGAVRSGITQFALIAGAIGGAVAVFKKLGSAIINSSDYLKDNWEVAVNQSKAAWEVFKQSMATLDFSNFFANMSSAVTLAEEYTRGMQKVEDQMRSLGIQEIKYQGELARLKKIYMDVGLSIDQRTEALKKYEALVLELGTKETTLTKNQYDLELKTAAQRTGLTEKQIMLFIEENDKMSELQQTALELSDNQIKAVGGPLNAWKFFVKSVTGGIFETGKANDKLIKQLQAAGYEGEKAFEFADKLKKLSPEQIKNLENFAKAYYGAQNKFDESTTRQEALQNRLENAAKKKSKTSEEELNREKLFIDDITIKRIEASEIEQQLADESIAMNEEVTKRRIESEKVANEKIIEDRKNLIQKIGEYAQLGFNTLASIEDSIYTLKSNNIESEIGALEKKRNVEIAAAEQAGRSTLAIEEKYAKRESALKKKQAIRDKKHARNQSIINTALSITAALTSIPPNVPLSIANGIVGGIQTGVIMATDIPEFFKGTSFMPKDTIGSIAEKGAEAFKIPGKSWDIAYNKSMGYFPRGTKILTHEQTKEKINDLNLDLTPLLIEQRKTRQSMRSERFDPRIMKMVIITDKTRQILLSRRFE